MLDEMLSHIPWEMRKSDILNKYFKVVEKVFNEYMEEIKENSNYAIYGELKGARLEKYGDRYGAIRRPRWRDDTYIRAVALARRSYNSDMGIIDNFHGLITESTGYGLELSYNKFDDLPEPGAITAKLNIPPFEPPDFIQELDKYFVYGCRIDFDVFSKLDINFMPKLGNSIYEHHKFITTDNDWR